MTIYNSAQKTKAFCDNAINNGDEGIVVYIPTDIWVLTDKEKCYDETFVTENNIPVIRLGNEGGCIIAFPGNIEIGHFSKTLDFDFGNRVKSNVLEFLKGKGLNVSCNNNDVLIDGKYKVFSWSSRRFDEVLFTAFHCSINCDAELIRNICTKPMVKIPKGLTDYGITTEEMLALLGAELEKG